MAIEPHAPWCHRLKNGAPAGNPTLAPRCGARTRNGTACRQPAMKNGRCRLHGGHSTGPRTDAGIERIRAARTRHGYWAPERRALRRDLAALAAQARLWIVISDSRRQSPDVAARRIEHALALAVAADPAARPHYQDFTCHQTSAAIPPPSRRARTPA